jgi:hypothetical protein
MSQAQYICFYRIRFTSIAVAHIPVLGARKLLRLRSQLLQPSASFLEKLPSIH